MSRRIHFAALILFFAGAQVSSARTWSWNEVLLKPDLARGGSVDWALAFQSTGLKPLPDGAGYVDCAVVTGQPYQRVWVVPPTKPGTRSPGNVMRVRGRLLGLVLDEVGSTVLVQRLPGSDPSALASTATRDYEDALRTWEAKQAKPAPGTVTGSNNGSKNKPTKKIESASSGIPHPRNGSMGATLASPSPKKSEPEKVSELALPKSKSQPSKPEPEPAKPRSEPTKPKVEERGPEPGPAKPTSAVKPKAPTKSKEIPQKKEPKPKSAKVSSKDKPVKPKSKASEPSAPAPSAPQASTGASSGGPTPKAEVPEGDARRNSSGLEWKEESWIAVVERGCSLRAGPGTAFVPLPDTVEESIVRVEGSRGPWCFVRKGQVTGWIYRSCLRKPKSLK